MTTETNNPEEKPKGPPDLNNYYQNQNNTKKEIIVCPWCNKIVNRDSDECPHCNTLLFHEKKTVEQRIETIKNYNYGQ